MRCVWQCSSLLRSSPLLLLPTFCPLTSPLCSQLRTELVDHVLGNTLGQMPLFSKLSPQFRLALFPILKPLTRAAGEVVYEKGERSLSLYFLLSGSVTYYRDSKPFGRIVASGAQCQEFMLDPDGQPVVDLESQGCFGQSALLGRRTNGTAIADGSVELVLIGKEDLDGLFESDPSTSRRICKVSARATSSPAHPPFRPSTSALPPPPRL